MIAPEIYRAETNIVNLKKTLEDQKPLVGDWHGVAINLM